MKMLGAKGVIPGAPPADALAVIAALLESNEPKVAEAARATFNDPPKALLDGALNAELQVAVLSALVLAQPRNRDVLAKLLKQQALTEDLLATLASKADEACGEIIATNEALLLKFPAAIEKLYMNKAVRMSTSDRLIELAVRNKIDLDFPAFRLASLAIMDQLIPESTEEPTFDDVHFVETAAVAEEAEIGDEEDVCERDEEGQEQLTKKAVPLFKALEDMTITGKIRRAMLGNSTERLLLVRDSNRLVAEAAARSPRMSENDAARIAASRSVSDEVLRIIANNRELVRSYQVKLNLVTNPRTPFTFSARLMPHLREMDVRNLAKSKNIPGAVQKAAKNQLARKK